MIWSMSLLAVGLMGLGAWIVFARRQLQTQLTRLEKRLEDLEAGLVPEHEKAKAAAAAVNDFNAGIVGILGFDPFDARKAGTQ